MTLRTGSGALVALIVAVLIASPASAAPEGHWIAGDGHVHTCYSHDAFCVGKDNPDVIYSSQGTVDERFTEASLKGLQFLVISDHDDIRAQSDPAFGTHGVLGIQAYEASLKGGHAQMLGATHLYDKGDGGIAATNALANALRADGGLFQANHPGYTSKAKVSTCADVAETNPNNPMHWKYGFAVLPNTVEVWNATTLIQPSELFWECWLQRGARLPATAGSDSHGANQANLGFPTMWVFARSVSQPDILRAIHDGRTTLSRVAPRQGAVRLILEGDRNRDGKYESMIGDQVPPGTPLRVRAEGAPGLGLVRVRENGQTVVEGASLAPGGEVKFKAPDYAGWARAELYLAGGTRAVDPGCAPIGQPISTCSEDLGLAAMTSPIWVGAPVPPISNPGGPVQPTVPDSQEPDRGKPRPPKGGNQMPDVPPQRGRGAAIRRLSVGSSEAGEHYRIHLRWSPHVQGPFEIQARRSGAHWSVLARHRRHHGLNFSLGSGEWTFRVRARPPFARPGPWRSTGLQLRG